MSEKNIWKERCKVTEKELHSVQEDAKQLLRSNIRKDVTNKNKDRIIESMAARIEELEHLAQGVQITGGSLVGKMTQALRKK